MTEDDLSGIEKAVAANPCRPSIEQVKASLTRGESVLWRFSKDGEWKGVVLVLLRLEQETPDLFVWLIGGSEFKKNIKYLEQVLVEYGKLMGAKFIRGHAMAHVARNLVSLGYREEYVCVAKEI
jgi:hypothetical protein